MQEIATHYPVPGSWVVKAKGAENEWSWRNLGSSTSPFYSFNTVKLLKCCVPVDVELMEVRKTSKLSWESTRYDELHRLMEFSLRLLHRNISFSSVHLPDWSKWDSGRWAIYDLSAFKVTSGWILVEQHSSWQQSYVWHLMEVESWMISNVLEALVLEVRASRMTANLAQIHDALMRQSEVAREHFCPWFLRGCHYSYKSHRLEHDQYDSRRLHGWRRGEGRFADLIGTLRAKSVSAGAYSVCWNIDRHPPSPTNFGVPSLWSSPAHQKKNKWAWP